MSEGYDSDSCNALEKPFYRPVEAALRWCNLINYEEQILSVIREEVVPKQGDFPQWPCLRANAERIFDAMLNRELPCGRDGRSVSPGETVASARMTVRHTDLKAWITKHHPGQKPAFLFDETEQNTHASINADSFNTLQADRDALRAELNKSQKEKQQLVDSNSELTNQNIELRNDLARARAGSEEPPGDRSVRTYQNIIAALLECILGEAPSIERHPFFDSQNKLIEFIADKYRGYDGLSASTLSHKFPEARQTLNSR